MTEVRHKTLGTFTQREEFDEIRWETDLELPAFAAFCYRRNGKRRRSKKVPIAIRGDAEPTKASIKMLQTIKRSQKQLVKNICTTFLEDLRQHGWKTSAKSRILWRSMTARRRGKHDASGYASRGD